MTRPGQWGCASCAQRDGYVWGDNSTYRGTGWCGLGHHRTTETLEFIPDAIPGERVNGAPATTQVSETAYRRRVKPAPAPAAAEPSHTQMELF